jgi:3-demethoxyubiquinol 3-hydroxylase
MIHAAITVFDAALRTLNNVGTVSRQYPPDIDVADSALAFDGLSSQEQRHAAGLMRVNHVGEVCAQALYAGQALMAKTPQIKQFNEHAAQEEQDHLLWTAQRLRELNARPSLLNPMWYAGALGLGVVAGALGDTTSLAFVKETEAQVEAHLHSHETKLPAADTRSLAIVRQMKLDEAAHGQQAAQLGGIDLPAPVRFAMRTSAKLMTGLAYWV